MNVNPVDEKMTIICDKIREYTNSNDLIGLDDMPVEIDKVYSKGQAAGGGLFEKVRGFARIFYQSEWESGTNLVLDVSNHYPSDFYDLQYAFGAAKGLKSIKIIATEKKKTNYTYAFTSYKGETIDLSDCNLISNLAAAFQYGSENLKKIIGELDCSYCLYATNLGNSCFASCPGLEEVRFKPNSIPFSIGFASSDKLSDESIQSIINGLADNTGQTAQKLDLHADVVLKLTEEQTAQIYAKNWSVI